MSYVYILLLLCNICSVLAFDIWSAPMQPGWPTTLAVIIPPGTQFTKPTYTWNFPGESSQTCTVDGKANVACVGNVLDHVFTTEGNKSVELTISDATLPTPAKVVTTVMIKPLSAFPIVGRAEIRQVDPVSWNRTVYALYNLMDLGVYQHLASIHYHTFENDVGAGTGRSSAHRGPAFLPWHRVSMRVTEVCLQTMLQDPNFALPFLDWRMGWKGLDSYLGSSGNPLNSDVVESGPFCNDPKQQPSAKCPKRWILPPNFPDEIKGIKRTFGKNYPEHLQTQSEYDALLNASIYDAAPYSEVVASQDSFRSALEGFTAGKYGPAHNGFHAWMGGTMGMTSISFYDPAFLVHHVNVDHFLTSWQAKHGCSDGRSSGNCYSPRDDEPNLKSVAGSVQRTSSTTGQTVWALSGQMYSDRMYPWGIKVSEALRAQAGYRYLRDGEKPVAISAPPPSPLIAPINVTVPDPSVTPLDPSIDSREVEVPIQAAASNMISASVLVSTGATFLGLSLV